MTITTQEMEQLAERAGDMLPQVRADRDAAIDAVDAFYAEHGDIDAGDALCRKADELAGHRNALVDLTYSLTQLRLAAETVRSNLRRIELTKETAK